MIYNISLDTSVKGIDKEVAMHLSGVICNGVLLTQNPNPTIIIKKDRIDFGRCLAPDIEDYSGLLVANFYVEYGSIIYHFGSNIKRGLFNHRLEYCGSMAPTTPDDYDIFKQIYPKFS